MRMHSKHFCRQQCWTCSPSTWIAVVWLRRPRLRVEVSCGQCRVRKRGADNRAEESNQQRHWWRQHVTRPLYLPHRFTSSLTRLHCHGVLHDGAFNFTLVLSLQHQRRRPYLPTADLSSAPPHSFYWSWRLSVSRLCSFYYFSASFFFPFFCCILFDPVGTLCASSAGVVVVGCRCVCACHRCQRTRHRRHSPLEPPKPSHLLDDDVIV